MYQELAIFLNQNYNISNNAFDITLDELNPVRTDIDLVYYELYPIENTSIPSYSYKEPILRNWKCITLQLNPQRVSQIAEQLNEFLNEHNSELINLYELNLCRQNFTEFQYTLAQGGLVFLLFKYSLTQSIIEITIPQ